MNTTAKPERTKGAALAWSDELGFRLKLTLAFFMLALISVTTIKPGMLALQNGEKGNAYRRVIKRIFRL